MSGYLNRLIRRTQAASESQLLRPFVRSASPITEHDQRLGVAGFEDAEKGISPPTAVDPDPDLEQAGEGQALITPDITASSDITVQRKIASSTTPTTSIASNPSPASVPGSSDIPSAKIRTDRNNPPGFSGGEQPELLAPSGRESRASVQGDRSEGSTASLSSPMLSSPMLSPPMTGKSGNQPHSSNRDRQRYADEQQPQLRPTLTASQVPEITIETNRMAETATDSVAPPLDMPYPNRSLVVEGEEIAKLNDLSPQSRLQTLQSTVPSLEPSTHSLVDRDELWVDSSTVSNMDRNDSPQVVIGRITVEVVPQTTTEATVATSRSGPLTAASVSVIGPLGSGVRSNLRLSLRQR